MNRPKIALTQPIAKAGESLGIQKAPAGIMSLAAQLIREGFVVKMFHAEMNESFRQELREFGPNYVCISTMTPNAPDGFEVAKITKGINDEITTIMGGWHVWGCAKAYQEGSDQESLQEIMDADIDYAVQGEGDITLPRLIQSLEEGSDVTDLPGLIVTRDGEIHVNEPSRIEDLDKLADPSYEGLPMNIYRDKRTGALDLSIHAKRACRFSCNFCSTASSYGRGVRKFSPDRTVGNLERILEGFKPEVITFTDEDFFADLRWVEEVVTLIEQTGLHEKYGTTFDTFASAPDLIRLKRTGRKNLLERMAAVGFGSFTIGIESFVPKTLRKYGKEPMILATMTRDEKSAYRENPTPEELVDQHFKATQEAIDFALECGILCVGDYMVGNPNETQEETTKGFEKFSSLRNLFLAYIPTLTPYPGTALWGEAYESGRLKRTDEGGIDWRTFNASDGAMEMPYDVAKFRNKLERKFYTSPRYIADMTKFLWKNPKAYKMFLARYKYLAKRALNLQ